MNRRRRATVLLAAAALACGRGDGGQPPSTAGDLSISYFQGVGEAGAILLTISGGPVEGVAAAPGRDIQVSSAALSPGTTRVILTGTLQTGDLLRVRVPDVTQSTAYSVRADQVADNVTFALIDPSTHTFTIHR